GLRVPTVGHGAGADRDLGLALAILEALAVEERTLLFASDPRPVRGLAGGESVKFGNLGHRSSLHLSSATRRYSSARSIPMDFLPNWNATRFVVPVPAKGSSTTPPSGQVDKIGILQRSSGYGAKCSARFWVSSGRMSQTSLGLLPRGWYLRK